MEMSVYLFMFELDETVGNPDASSEIREYVLQRFDSVAHAHRVLLEREAEFVENNPKARRWSRPGHGSGYEYTQLIVNRGRNHEMGNIYRKTWFSIQF